MALAFLSVYFSSYDAAYLLLVAQNQSSVLPTLFV